MYHTDILNVAERCHVEGASEKAKTLLRAQSRGISVSGCADHLHPCVSCAASAYKSVSNSGQVLCDVGTSRVPVSVLGVYKTLPPDFPQIQ